MGQAYFITGTDTAVGKTAVATALLRLANERGLSTLGLKPVSAGCTNRDGQLMNDDARELMNESSTDPDYQTVNPVALREAMAPHIAAEREHRELSCADLAAHCLPLLEDTDNGADFIVVEGAGGWQVPLNQQETMADLAIELDCPVILVVGMRLGCINHALLTAAAIRETRLGIAGWVANHIDPDMPVADENVATLQTWLDAPLLGRVPWQADLAGVAAHLDLELLL